MPLGFNSSKEIAVLEGKFQIYEDLSKEMLDKLERAVEKISEGNQKVALILAKHEEKIEQGIYTYKYFFMENDPRHSVRNYVTHGIL